MFSVSGAGFISAINRQEKKMFLVNEAKGGSIVTFKVVTKVFSNGENSYDSILCKRFIKGDPQPFCNTLIEKQHVYFYGTLNQYYNKNTKTNSISVMCNSVEFIGDKPVMNQLPEATIDETSTSCFE